MSNSNNFPISIQYAVWQKTLGKCWYCGCELKTYEVRDQWHQDVRDRYSIDHLTPKGQGGSGAIDNLVPCCRSCNSAKGGKSVEEYREFLQWKGIGRFKLSQILWLHSYGIELPEPTQIVFYFEEAAL